METIIFNNNNNNTFSIYSSSTFSSTTSASSSSFHIRLFRRPFFGYVLYFSVSRYHSVWLRHNCHCENCKQKASGQKLLDVASVPTDIPLHQVTVRGDNGGKTVCSHRKVKGKTGSLGPFFFS